MDYIIKFLAEFFAELISKLFHTHNRKKSLCSPVSGKVGFLAPGEIEKYHPLYFLIENIWQDEENTLIIGSPHLKYWFETENDPRMLSFLRKTKSFKVSVKYYANNEEGGNKTVKESLEKCKTQYPERFFYMITNTASSLSYIAYKIKYRRHTYFRCIVGFQGTAYSERPFIEFFGREENMPSFVKSILKSHEERCQ